MIQYTLKCAKGHQFDSWFQSADRYEELRAAGHVTCAVCGSAEVEKAMMAPRIRPARDKGETLPAQPVATAPDADMQAALEKMRREVETKSEYVGGKFASEARAMHLGDAPERAIYGEARPDEAKSLIEDGVPVLPLPFRPTKSVN